MKEPFGENRLLTSLFVNKLIKNSRWLPGGHLVFSITEFHLGPSRDQDQYMCEVS